MVVVVVVVVVVVAAPDIVIPAEFDARVANEELNAETDKLYELPGDTAQLTLVPPYPDDESIVTPPELKVYEYSAVPDGGLDQLPVSEVDEFSVRVTVNGADAGVVTLAEFDARTVKDELFAETVRV